MTTAAAIERYRGPGGWAALLAAAVLGLAAAGWAAAHIVERSEAEFADADNAAMTLQGSRIYWRECRGCHGSHLQGQPFWQLADADFGRRAPALDQTGRAWRRSDAELFERIRSGRDPRRPQGAASYMPAFEGALKDHDILAVIAFVKGTWPTSLRSLQAQRNPDQRGMPADGPATDWRLPPTCFSSDVVAQTR